MPGDDRFCTCMLAACIFLGAISIAPSSGFAAETIIYTEGFEADNGGYSVDGNTEWAWGAPTKTSGPLKANFGANCWGTDQPAEVVGTVEGNLYSPPITIPVLSAGQLARVQFYAYIDVNYEEYGEGDFYLSSDGMQTWQLLGRFYEKMTGGWQRYVFNVSEYAGKDVHLRFRAFMQSSDPGLYIDDVAITIEDVPSPSVLLSLEASEDTAASASCPWVYPWDGTGFVRDNDIYSVARYPQGEMRDYYLLQKPLLAQENHYAVEIREIAAEDSWTDLLSLLAVDHPLEVAVAPDGSGNVLAYRPAELVTPVSAVSSAGSDVLSSVRGKDNSGFKAYSDDYVDLDFGLTDVSAGARVVLRMKGFIAGEGIVKPFTGPPAILVQVRNDQGDWQEIGRLNPRFEWSEGAFDLTSSLPDPTGQLRIRLTAISHDVKYHEIDFVALATGPSPVVTVTELPMLTASRGEEDVLASLSGADNDYVSLSSGNKFTVTFAATPQLSGMTRDFILASEGYYVPKSSTFFLYTWDGSQWWQRDSYSFNTTDSVKIFDLSSYLPDPGGEYKIRLWQDYSNYPASIDYLGLQIESVAQTLSTARDLRNNSSVMDLVRHSDDLRIEYPRDAVKKLPRNRWSEYSWAVIGACGSSHTGIFTVAPTVNRCSAGIASAVTGSGHPWSWSCAGTNGGTTASCSATMQSWSVTPVAGNNGSLSPATSQMVDHGAGTSFTMTPASGYQLASVSGCGGTLAGTAYTTGAITGDCSVVATFSAIAIIPHDGIVTAGSTSPTIIDALAVLRHVVGQAPLTANQQIHADVAPLAPDGKPRGNDVVDIADVIIILRRVIGAAVW